MSFLDVLFLATMSYEILHQILHQMSSLKQPRPAPLVRYRRATADLSLGWSLGSQEGPGVAEWVAFFRGKEGKIP